MRSFCLFLALVCGVVGRAVSEEPKAQFLFANDDVLLKLDYATYRGYYNDTNEVSISTSSSKVGFNHVSIGLHIQKHSLCCSSRGRIKMGETSSTTENGGDPRSKRSDCLLATFFL
jgi:hypothetical protein